MVTPTAATGKELKALIKARLPAARERLSCNWERIERTPPSRGAACDGACAATGKELKAFTEEVPARVQAATTGKELKVVDARPRLLAHLLPRRCNWERIESKRRRVFLQRRDIVLAVPAATGKEIESERPKRGGPVVEAVLLLLLQLGKS